MDNIKVAIRVRALIPREVSAGAKSRWIIRDNSIFQDDAEWKDSTFTFDSISDHSKTNLEVFAEIAQPIIAGVMKGINGSVFAYGQTSSGKTYTMLGDSRQPGIIPLAIQEIFEAIENTPDREFLLRVSYMEIYNEEIQDLLTGAKNLKIRETADREVYVADLKEQLVTDAQQIYDLMRQGEQRRHTGATNMNEHSSRSHTIFRVIVESRQRVCSGEEADLAVNVSHMNLVDLAGSERTNQTGATGDRFKEGCAINKSLFTLGYVICKLSEGENHVPFRDSKLTRILQNSLGGNSRTAIVCTVTPAAVDETISTLKFASRAKIIRNRPTVNEVVSDEALLRRYRKQIQELQKQLEQGSTTSLDANHPDVAALERQLAEKSQKESELRSLVDRLTAMLCVSHSGGEQIAPPVSGFARKEKRRETWCPGRQTVRWNLAGDSGSDFQRLRAASARPTSMIGDDFGFVQSAEDVLNAAELSRLAEMDMTEPALPQLPPTLAQRILASSATDGEACGDVEALRLTPAAMLTGSRDSVAPDVAVAAVQTDPDDSRVSELQHETNVLRQENALLKNLMEELECDLKNHHEKQLANVQQALHAAEWQRDELEKEVLSLRFVRSQPADEPSSTAGGQPPTPAAGSTDAECGQTVDEALQVELLYSQVHDTGRLLEAKHAENACLTRQMEDLQKENARLSDDLAALQLRFSETENNSLWAYEVIETFVGDLGSRDVEMAEMRNKIISKTDSSSGSTQTTPFVSRTASIASGLERTPITPRTRPDNRSLLDSGAAAKRENKILLDGMITARERIDRVLEAMQQLKDEHVAQREILTAEFEARIGILDGTCRRLQSELAATSQQRDELLQQLSCMTNEAQGEDQSQLSARATSAESECSNLKSALEAVTCDRDRLLNEAKAVALRETVHEAAIHETLVVPSKRSRPSDCTLLENSYFDATTYMDMMREQQPLNGPNLFDELRLASHASVVSPHRSVNSTVHNDYSSCTQKAVDADPTLGEQLSQARAIIAGLELERDSLKAAAAAMEAQLQQSAARTQAISVACQTSPARLCSASARWSPAVAGRSLAVVGTPCATTGVAAPTSSPLGVPAATPVVATIRPLRRSAADFSAQSGRLMQHESAEHVLAESNDMRDVPTDVPGAAEHEPSDSLDQAAFKDSSRRSESSIADETFTGLRSLLQASQEKLNSSTTSASAVAQEATHEHIQVSTGQEPEEIHVDGDLCIEHPLSEENRPTDSALSEVPAHGSPRTTPECIASEASQPSSNDETATSDRLAIAEAEVARLRAALDEQMRIETCYMEVIAELRKEADDMSSKLAIAEDKYLLQKSHVLNDDVATLTTVHPPQTTSDECLVRSSNLSVDGDEALIEKKAVSQWDTVDERVTASPSKPTQQDFDSRDQPLASHSHNLELLDAQLLASKDENAKLLLELRERCAEIQRLGDMLSAAELRAVEVEATAEDLRGKLSEQQCRSADLTDKFTVLTAEMDAVQHKLASSVEESAQLCGALNCWTDSAQKSRVEADSLRDQLEEMKSSLEAAGSTVQELKSELRSEQAERCRFEEANMLLVEQLDNGSRKLLAAAEQQSTLQAALHQGELEISRLKEQLESKPCDSRSAELEDAAVELRTELEAARESESRSRESLALASSLLDETKNLLSASRSDNVRLSDELAAQTNRVARLECELAALVAKQAVEKTANSLLDELQQQRQSYADLEALLVQTKEQAAKTVATVLEKAEVDNLLLKSCMDDCCAEMEKLKSDLSEAELLLAESRSGAELVRAELQDQLRAERERASSLVGHVNTLKQQLDTLDQQRCQAEAESRDLHYVTEEQQKEIMELQVRVRQLEDCLAEEEADRLQDQMQADGDIKAKDAEIARLQHFRVLVDDKDAQLEHLKDELQCAEQRHEAIVSELRSATTRRDELQTTADRLREQLQDGERRNEEQLHKITELQDLLKEAQTNGSSLAVSTADRSKATIDQSTAVPRAKYEYAAQKALEFKKEKEQLAEKLSELQRKLESPTDHWQALIAKKDDKIERLEEEVQRVMRCCEEADNELDDERAQHEKLKATVAELHDKLSCATAAAVEAAAKADQLQSTLRSENVELRLKAGKLENEMTAQIQLLQRQALVDDKDTQLEHLKDELRCAEHRHEAIVSELRSATTRCDELQTAADGLREQLQDGERRNEEQLLKITELQDLLKEAQTNGSSLAVSTADRSKATSDQSTTVPRAKYEYAAQKALEFKREKEQLAEKLSELQRKLESPADHWQALIAKKNDKIERLEEEVQRVMRCCEEADNELDDERAQHEKLKATVAELHDKLSCATAAASAAHAGGAKTTANAEAAATADQLQSTLRSENFELRLKAEELEREMTAQTQLLRRQISELNKEKASLRERCALYKNEVRRLVSSQHDVTVRAKKQADATVQCDLVADRSRLPTSAESTSGAGSSAKTAYLALPLQPPSCGIIEELEKDRLKQEVQQLRRQLKHSQQQHAAASRTIQAPPAIQLGKASETVGLASTTAALVSTTSLPKATSTATEYFAEKLLTAAALPSPPATAGHLLQPPVADHQPADLHQIRAPLSGITNSPQRTVPPKVKFFPSVQFGSSPARVPAQSVTTTNQPPPAADDDNITGCKQQ